MLQDSGAGLFPRNGGSCPGGLVRIVVYLGRFMCSLHAFSEFTKP